MSHLQTAFADLRAAYARFSEVCERSALPDYAKPSVLIALFDPARSKGECLIAGDPEAVTAVLQRAALDEGNEGLRDALCELGEELGRAD